MGFWDRWFDRKSNVSMSSVDLLREMLGANRSQSGVVVNAETALQASVVFACVRAIAEGLMQVPWRLMKFDGRTRLPAIDHPLYPLFDGDPNEWQTTAEFIEQIGLHLALANNSYVWLNRPAGTVVRELLPLEPSKVVQRRVGWVSDFLVTMPDGSQVTVPFEEMWHLRGPSWNGWHGLEGWKLAREAIGLSLAAEQHGASTFSSGAQLGGLLSTDQVMSADQRKALRDSWQTVHSGRENAGKIAVLSNGYKFQPIASTNENAQWIDARRFQIEEVCRAFRVMPIMVGYSDKAATYASAEQMFIAHVVHTLGPWYRRIEASANKRLLSSVDRRAGLYTKFFTNALLRGAVKDRGEFYTKLYSVGAINGNEIRELEDMNPYPGGDVFRVPMNMEDANAPKTGPNGAA